MKKETWKTLIQILVSILSFVVKDRRLQGRLFESVSQKLAKS